MDRWWIQVLLICQRFTHKNHLILICQRNMKKKMPDPWISYESKWPGYVSTASLWLLLLLGRRIWWVSQDQFPFSMRLGLGHVVSKIGFLSWWCKTQQINYPQRPEATHISLFVFLYTLDESNIPASILLDSPTSSNIWISWQSLWRMMAPVSFVFF